MENLLCVHFWCVEVDWVWLYWNFCIESITTVLELKRIEPSVRHMHIIRSLTLLVLFLRRVSAALFLPPWLRVYAVLSLKLLYPGIINLLLAFILLIVLVIFIKTSTVCELRGDPQIWVIGLKVTLKRVGRAIWDYIWRVRFVHRLSARNLLYGLSGKPHSRAQILEGLLGYLRIVYISTESMILVRVDVRLVDPLVKVFWF